VAACVRIWTVPYTSKKLALLLILRNLVNSAKKVRASLRAGVTPQMTNLKRQSPADGSSPAVRLHLEREEEGYERLSLLPAHVDNGRRVSDGCQRKELQALREGIGRRWGW